MPRIKIHIAIGQYEFIEIENEVAMADVQEAIDKLALLDYTPLQNRGVKQAEDWSQPDTFNEPKSLSQHVEPLSPPLPMDSKLIVCQCGAIPIENPKRKKDHKYYNPKAPSYICPKCNYCGWADDQGNVNKWYPPKPRGDK